MASVRRIPLFLGMALAVSFFVVLALILSPVFGGRNGLDYADDLFNRLSKGSSYFIPKLLKKNEQQMGKPFRVTLTIGNEFEQIEHICTLAGIKTERKGTTLIVQGNLGEVLGVALRDSDNMFNNNGSEVAKYYQLDEKKVMQDWWTILTKIEKQLKKNLQIKEADAVSEVVRKGIEPAYNFYKVDAQKVSDRAGIMSLMLVFYVVYTLWWGYAILFLFEGLGLSMKKAKVKKEVG
jgi:hypothetical protein